MGTDLEDVLKKLKEFRRLMDYWFDCTGKTDVHLISQVDDLEQALREYNENL